MFQRHHLRSILSSFFLVFTTPFLWAQAPTTYTGADIQQAIAKLNVVGSALYVAAHPDDENTRLIAWLADEKLLNTGYLSLTRGDGGQNLIGSEIREQLGVIRTQELLQARRIDGGKQFFSRANDFGFSKDWQETMRIWDKEQVLSDMVWTIRKFRPDVLITRFSPKPGGTHGHHTTSAILAVEAFSAAGDKNRFPEQLKTVEVWQPKRILWNTSTFFYGQNQKFDETGKVIVDVGGYNAALGKSYGELSALSRSMHKSQGFGSSGARGSEKEYFENLKGDKATKDLFEGIDLTWKRVPGGEKISKQLTKITTGFNAAKPAASVPDLLSLRQTMQALPASYYRDLKLTELDVIIKACLGLYLEAVAAEPTTTPGATLQLTLEGINRSDIPVQWQKIKILPAGKDSTLNLNLSNNQDVILKSKITIPANTPYSQPYWLQKPGTTGMFTVEDTNLIGRPENAPAATVVCDLVIGKQPFTFTLPVIYKRTDPVAGEVYRPFEITPPVFVSISEKVFVFADDQPKPITVRVKAGQAAISGEATLAVPAGWRVEPARLPFKLAQKGEEVNFTFTVYPSKNQSDGEIRATALVDGKTYQQSLVQINYAHIPAQTILPVASARVTKLDLKIKGRQIAYLMGAGDEVATSLAQIGYSVTMLQDRDINAKELVKYDAVVLGVRAFNTQDPLKFLKNQLMEYVKNGGTLIVQYNVNNGLVTNELGPYPLTLSRDRVSDENAPVEFLNQQHPVLNAPNKITSKDFEGWVQERGLYFANSWDKNYEAILTAHDPGEPDQKGGLLVAQYGKGYYVYTGYAWFRQLPAGVPGAYRLFSNLLSLGKK
ncbi:PIG-L family deacetylase [Adhaeribacter swui]|uniref:PIG-L family deacetylase n=1 Tax=Adhaeribacter swui TaxID=2086471 RepID=A0A7G7G946_9BACT|nr:PIG-L family deacetylase [Adhaeribacter swui]QNF33680.1 PIG-L family deacetylase [Adhaeribacter swui]